MCEAAPTAEIEVASQCGRPESKLERQWFSQPGRPGCILALKHELQEVSVATLAVLAVDIASEFVLGDVRPPLGEPFVARLMWLGEFKNLREWWGQSRGRVDASPCQAHRPCTWRGELY
eukprot:283118-Pleurochrysis_carterae.AAC.2